jgi:type II secretory pathway pseudopilin PulG
MKINDSHETCKRNEDKCTVSVDLFTQINDAGFEGTNNNSGITMLEIVMAAALILIFAGLIIPWQMSSWKRTSGYTRMTSASRIIEKQIEQRRITISMNPDSNYQKFKTLTDTTLWDSTITPPIKFTWNITPAKDPFGNTLNNVRWVKITARWGVTDTLVVRTAIAKNF